MDLDLPSSLIDRTFILLNSQSGALETVDPGLLVIYSLLLVVLIIGSALVSGSEVAFFSLSHNEFAQLEQEEGRRAKAILKLKEIPRTLLATILIANNFINIAIVLISDLIVELSLGILLSHKHRPGFLQIPMAYYLQKLGQMYCRIP